jgi:hypothetical protein
LDLVADATLKHNEPPNAIFTNVGTRQSDAPFGFTLVGGADVACTGDYQTGVNSSHSRISTKTGERWARLPKRSEKERSGSGR